MSKVLQSRLLGITDYTTTWQQMREFTEGRNSESPDEIWFLEHKSVFTLGLAGKPEHLLYNPEQIPVIKTDRGGQITYHGLGQLIGYTLIDLKRLKISIREFVMRLEQGIINYLAQADGLNIEAHARRNAPGVYVGDKKIASLGLKVRKGCTYHGISLNVAMNTTPFKYINVCGYEKLEVAQLCDFKPDIDIAAVIPVLLAALEDSIYGSTDLPIHHSKE
jgi:lipoyl(octanoyl) transferase